MSYGSATSAVMFIMAIIRVTDMLPTTQPLVKGKTACVIDHGTVTDWPFPLLTFSEWENEVSYFKNCFWIVEISEFVDS